MSQCKSRIIKQSSKNQVNKPPHYRRLRIGMRSMDISSREWVEVISKSIYFFDGVILTPEGIPWKLPEDIDEIVNHRTISNFLEGSDDEPRRIARKLEAVQIYDLTFKIKWPLIARHFSK